MPISSPVLQTTELPFIAVRDSASPIVAHTSSTPLFATPKSSLEQPVIPNPRTAKDVNNIFSYVYVFKLFISITKDVGHSLLFHHLLQILFHFYFDNLHFRSLIHFHIVCFHNFRTINLDYNFQ